MSRKFRFCVALVFVLSVFISHAVWAGDSDGVTGYSMRLKNKDISTGDGDGALGGNVVYAAPQAQPNVVSDTTPVVKFDRLWLVGISFPFIYAIWVH